MHHVLTRFIWLYIDVNSFIYAGRMTILIFQENVVVIVVVLITFIIAVALTATTLGHGIG